MGLEAEALLMSTGLVNPPDQTAILASRTVLKELEATLLAALELEEPKPLRAIPRPKTFLARLTREPPYPDWMEQILEPTLGLDEAGVYQSLHQDARQLLRDRYPAAAVDRLSGTQPVVPDPVKEGLWYMLVDAVENQRTGHDLQACAVLPATVEVFSAVFPESYQNLADSVRRAMSAKGATWHAPWWLEGALRVFLKAPAKAPLPPPAPPKPEKARKVDIDTDELKPEAL